MPDSSYDDIQNAWETEIESELLQDLEDLTLSRMTEYISKIRIELSRVSPDENLRLDILTQKILNLEFMLRDMLLLRRDKILRAAMARERPTAMMTLPEEEFYNRMFRGLQSHQLFIEESLAGTPPATFARSSLPSDDEINPNDSGEVEYVLVRFLQPVNDPIIGLDDSTYGPFKRGDIATIPIDNARIWLRDRVVVRISTEEDWSNE